MVSGHWTAKPKMLSVTESVNPVSFAESKRAYRGRSLLARVDGEVSSDHSSWATSHAEPWKSHEQ